MPEIKKLPPKLKQRLTEFKLTTIFIFTAVVIFSITVSISVYYLSNKEKKKYEEVATNAARQFIKDLSALLLYKVAEEDAEEIESMINYQYDRKESLTSIRVENENGKVLYERNERAKSSSSNYLIKFKRDLVIVGEKFGSINMTYDYHNKIKKFNAMTVSLIMKIVTIFSIFFVILIYLAEILIFQQLNSINDKILSIIQNKDIKEKRRFYFSKEISILNQSVEKLRKQKEGEKKLRKAQSETRIAVKASASMFSFLAKMCHEIRTPLTSIIGFANAIETKNMDTESKENLETIQNGGVYLKKIVNEVLDFSKITSGELELNEEPISLRAMMHEIIKVQKFRAEETKNKLVYKIDENLPDTFLADDLRLKQVLINLMSNAMKFTENGTISIFVDRLEDFSHAKIKHRFDKYGILFRVEDTGIGIRQEVIPTLFTAYKQAEKNTTKKFGGTGLGLPICKSLIEYMNGHIWIESEIGKGTSMCFYVYFDQTNKEPTNLKDNEDLNNSDNETIDSNLKKLKILIAEDTPQIQRLLGIIFKKIGYENVTIVSDGNEAIEELKQNPDYNVLFCDLNMPNMDGKSVVKNIRSGNVGKNYRNIPVAALTADVLSKNDCMELSFNGFVNKPVNPDNIKKFIKKHCQARNATNRN